MYDVYGLHVALMRNDLKVSEYIKPMALVPEYAIKLST